METTIKAPYSNWYGQKGEIQEVKFGGIIGAHIAKVKINDKVLTFTLDELSVSENDKETLSMQFKKHMAI